jgi:hypothetical protein
MPQEIKLAVYDVGPDTSARILSEAHRLYSRRRRHFAGVYDRILEPVLVAATVVATLTWALISIHSLLL